MWAWGARVPVPVHIRITPSTAADVYSDSWLQINLETHTHYGHVGMPRLSSFPGTDVSVRA